MSDPLPARPMRFLLPAAVALLAWLAWRARRAQAAHAMVTLPGHAHDNLADRRALARETGRMADA